MARPPAPAPAPSPTRRPPPGPRASARRPATRGRWLPTVLGVLLLAALVVIGAGALAFAAVDVPAPNKLALSATTTVLYKDGSVLGQYAGSVNRVPLTTDQMPLVMKQAAVASEDRSFYTNRGISISGIGRAVYGVLTKSDLGGGSTITQQYVKNISGDDDHTYTRKAKEAVIAIKLDRDVPKDQILTRYLNTIYFGRNANGVATAAKAYFGLDDPSQLTPQQAALLIGIIPAPNAWDPEKNPAQAQERYQYVLAGMVKTHAITQAEADSQPTMPKTVEPTDPQWFKGPDGYILEAVRTEAAKDLTMDTAAIANAGLTITTTIDPKLQKDAVDTMDDPKAYPTRNRPASVQAGLVSIDPGTGGVVAMYGGADYLQRQQSAILQDQAQAGSTFKAFTLIAALEQGVSLNSTWDGHSPQIIPGYNDASGKPVPVQNFGNEQEGQVNLLKATADSVNTVFVRLNKRVTPAATKEVAQRLGVTDAIPDTLSNVLGTATVHPIQMAGAYATLAAGGVHRTPHFVASISKGGKVAFEPDTAGTQAIDAEVNASAVYALQGVVKSGTAASAGRALGKRPAAGKTGTVQDNKAAWFNGFTPQLETAVVLYNVGEGGSQDKLPGFGSYREITGGTVPTTIWSSFMTKALKGTEVAQFPTPPRSATAVVPSSTATATATSTATATATDTPTDSPTATSTDSPTATESSEPTDGATPSGTSSGDGGRGGNGRSGRPTSGSSGSDG